MVRRITAPGDASTWVATIYQKVHDADMFGEIGSYLLLPPDAPDDRNANGVFLDTEDDAVAWLRAHPDWGIRMHEQGNRTNGGPRRDGILIDGQPR